MPKRYEDLTPAHRAKVDAFRARRATPEARAEEDRVRRRVEVELPPAAAPAELCEVMADLRAERERRGLSLADIADRTGLDRAMVSRLENGKIANPTLATLVRYAGALGKRVTLTLRDAAVAR